MSTAFDDDALQEGLGSGIPGRPRLGLGATLLQKPASFLQPQTGLGAALMNGATITAAFPLTPAPAAAGYQTPQAAAPTITGLPDIGVTSADIRQMQDAAKPAPFDVDKAVQYLDDNALPKYDDKTAGYCGKAVRLAIGAGGRNVERTESAKDYGPKLMQAGFARLDVDDFENYTPYKGDVVIYPAWGEHKNGHMQMYDGTQWVSDFKQHGGDGRYPGGDPKWKEQVFSVYRP
jgi:hypothetical protein